MVTAITGSTGELGQLVVQKIKEKVEATQIVALARNPDKASHLGVEIREADYTEPNTLEKSLKGVDTLLFISSNQIGQRLAQHKNIIQAAIKNKVKHIVYTSLLHADKSPINLASEHFKTEQYIKDSGLLYTILRNGWYSENYTASIKTALDLGAFYGCAGEGKISSATREDYAEAAVAVLTENGQHNNAIYELSGDDYYTLTDLAIEISRQTSKNIPYCNIAEKDYVAALIKSGLPDSLADMIASSDVSASENALFDNSHQLSKLIRRKTTPISVSIKKVLSQI